MEDLAQRGYEAVQGVGELGRGTFGFTKLFRHIPTGELRAVKFLRGDQISTNVAYVERELKNHRILVGHPGVIQFWEVFLADLPSGLPGHRDRFLGIAMEYAAGGELYDRVAKHSAGRFPEEVARYFFQQLVDSVAWCHSRGICHRDLKLKNVLLDLSNLPNDAFLSLAALAAYRPRLKICDFGYSKSSEHDSAPNTQVGSPAYVAPELLMDDNEYDGQLADVWSCGVTLFVMLTGCYPFQDPADPKNPRKMIMRIVTGQYAIPPSVQLSPGCQDLLARMFVTDPAHRITLQQISQHPWFQEDLAVALQGNGQAAHGAAQHVQQSEEEINQILYAALGMG